MDILTIQHVSFTHEDMLSAISTKRGKKPSDIMTNAACTAYEEGCKVMELKACITTYPVEETTKDSVIIKTQNGTVTIFIGPKADLLTPAKEIVIALCTAGKGIAEAMHRYSAENDPLMMYYLDQFGVKALAELSCKANTHVENYARAKGWKLGTTMQPGSLHGWDVTEQKTLFRLGHGKDLNISINEASMLIPHISTSSLIGIGETYTSDKTASMCKECPRFDTCLWRKENTPHE